MCVLYITTPAISQILRGRITCQLANKKSESVWSKAVVVCEGTTQVSTQVLRIKRKTAFRINGITAEIQTEDMLLGCIVQPTL
jgi:hypothetical protein